MGGASPSTASARRWSWITHWLANLLELDLLLSARMRIAARPREAHLSMSLSKFMVRARLSIGARSFYLRAGGEKGSARLRKVFGRGGEGYGGCGRI